jgi:hypothetical protein
LTPAPLAATPPLYTLALALAPVAVTVGLTAFSAVLLGIATWLAWRRRRPAPRPLLQAQRAAQGMICLSCLRQYDPGTVYCSVDARRLVPRNEAPERRSPGAHCPRCHRAFDPGTRYCPIDAEDLIPQALWETTHPPNDHDHDHGDDTGEAEDGSGKICPVCAAKYGLGASFCGRDGSELVTVN